MRHYGSGLTKVRKLTTSKRRAESAWRNAIREAVEDGDSLRAVGEAAGITHVRVLQIVREEPADDDWLYRSGHDMVASKRGRAKECEACGSTDPEKVYDWANVTGNFSDPHDYVRLCRRCHRAFDRVRRERPRLGVKRVLQIVREK